MFSLFLTCGQGLESLLAEECVQLGYPQVRIGFRGVSVDNVQWRDVYKLNYCSRLASRVLLPILQFKCFDRVSLYESLSEIDWSHYLGPRNTFAIDANVQHDVLRNSLFAAQIAKDAICDQMREKTGQRPSIDLKNPQVQLNLYIQHHRGIMSFDTSGSPLYKRGYRQETGEAPLQETLAAALLIIAKYEPSQILFDPCCGSGTFLIEAALIASQTPSGFYRKEWGFMRHPAFSQTDWLQVRNEIDAKRQPLLPHRLFGIDINKEMVRVCKSNLRAAGLTQSIEVVQAGFRDFAPKIAPTFLITNPPHGRRLMGAALPDLYRSLGDFMKQHMAKPSRAFVFVGNLELAKEVGLKPSRRHEIHYGGVDSRFLEFEIY